MIEQSETIKLHRPSLWKQALEKIGVEIPPRELCKTERDFTLLCEKYPDLVGDSKSFDPYVSGYCQSWRDYPGWWKKLFT